MRYKPKNRKSGDQEVKTWFAFLPVIVMGGEIRRLERVTVRRMWYDLHFTKGWENLEFIDNDKTLDYEQQNYV